MSKKKPWQSGYKSYYESKQANKQLAKLKAEFDKVVEKSETAAESVKGMALDWAIKDEAHKMHEHQLNAINHLMKKYSTSIGWTETSDGLTFTQKYDQSMPPFWKPGGPMETGDNNKTYVAGLPDVSGSFSGSSIKYGVGFDQNHEGLSSLFGLQIQRADPDPSKYKAEFWGGPKDGTTAMVQSDSGNYDAPKRLLFPQVSAFTSYADYAEGANDPMVREVVYLRESWDVQRGTATYLVEGEDW